VKSGLAREGERAKAQTVAVTGVIFLVEIGIFIVAGMI